MVKYCNAACKKKHRPKHKKKCDRLVAKLYDDALFKRPPPQDDDCPICFLRMPTLESGCKYHACCGKVICSGCSYANVKRDENSNKQLCAFCRTPASKTDERLKKRLEIGDANAFYTMGVLYSIGSRGFQRNDAKALDFFHRAGELGHATSYFNIGHAYNFAQGVEVDKKKAKYNYELAAMKVQVTARNNLGCMEEEKGDMDREKALDDSTQGWIR